MNTFNYPFTKRASRRERNRYSVKYRWQRWIIKPQIKFQRTSNSLRLIIKVDKVKYFECKYFVWKEERGISRTSGRENSIATTLLREETISAPPPLYGRSSTAIQFPRPFCH